LLNKKQNPIQSNVTLPLAILTLGIAWFFVSLLMLIITRGIIGGFHIHGFGTLVAATLIVWVVNLVLDHTPGPWQVTGRRRKRRRLREPSH
jgi:putative membrane protein